MCVAALGFCWGVLNLVGVTHSFGCLCFTTDRTPDDSVQKLVGHKQEVCGLKWSFDDSQLASGGNDNKLLVWNMHQNSPVMKFRRRFLSCHYLPRFFAWVLCRSAVCLSSFSLEVLCMVPEMYGTRETVGLSCLYSHNYVG